MMLEFLSQLNLCNLVFLIFQILLL